jgi:hypothetical protein
MKFQKLFNVILVGSAISLGACSAVRSGSGVTIKSSALTFASLDVLNQAERQLLPQTITDFKFCITQFKVKTSGTTGDASEAILGLVDLSDSALATWGNVDVAAGTEVEGMSFEIHHDPENCSGATYSLSYQGSEVQQDLEFEFEFNPAVTVVGGDALILNLNNVATILQGAADAGKLNNSDITSYVENNPISGSGEKED